MEARSSAQKSTPQGGFAPIFAQFAKIDEEQRMVFGYATTEKRDQQGEIVRLAAVEAALPDYMRFANIREMHQPWAVGTAEEASVDGVGFWIGAHVVDDDAWKKVKAKVYKGFSIGGKVTGRDPLDRSIITGLELTEVSIVDRPANPDAVFTVVKRVDGQLWEQPLQKWDCGVSGHQHRAKVEASTCMQDRAKSLQKTAAAATKAALALVAAADDATAAADADLEKGAPKDHESGKFSTHERLAAGAHKKRGAHDRAAAKAKDEERTHRAAAERALTAGDAAGVALHQHLTGAAASLAEVHNRAAGQYRDLASRHEQAIGKAQTTEDQMQVRTMSEATRDADAAVAALHKAITETPAEVQKAAIEHGTEARAARESALEHIGHAAEHEEAAAASREAARAAEKDGRKDDANAHQAEADVHDVTAAGHHEVAETLHELHAHHSALEMHKDGCDHAAHAAMAKDCAAGHAAMAQRHEAGAQVHDGMAKQAQAKGDTAQAKHHGEMAKRLTASAAKMKGLAATMTDVHKKAMDMHAAKAAKAQELEKAAKVEEAKKAAAEATAKAVADAAAAAHVIPVKGLKHTTGGWMDMTGVYFGKRELTDKQRVELVAKGRAMPNGSFPITDKDDLGEAIKAFGTAKEKDKVQSHIIKTALDLGAADALPKEWADALKIVQKATSGAAIDQIVEQPVKVPSGETNHAGATAGDASGVPGGGEKTRQAANVEAGLDAATEGVEKRAARVMKGMGLVAFLARLLEEIENAQRSSTMEQLYEGDSTSTLPKKLSDLCSQVADVLREAVTEETSELIAGDDVEAYAAASMPEAMKATYATERTEAPWHLSVVKTLRAKSMAETDTKKRARLKRIADVFEKVGAKPEIATVKKAAAVNGASPDDVAIAVAKAVDTERAAAVAALDKFTTAASAMAKEAAALRADNAKLGKKQAELEATLKRIGEQPLPPKGRVLTQGLSKADDSILGDRGAAEGDNVLAKAAAAEPGLDRAQTILDEGLAARERLLEKTRKN